MSSCARSTSPLITPASPSRPSEGTTFVAIPGVDLNEILCVEEAAQVHAGSSRRIVRVEQVQRRREFRRGNAGTFKSNVSEFDPSPEVAHPQAQSGRCPACTRKGFD